MLLNHFTSWFFYHESRLADIIEGIRFGSGGLGRFSGRADGVKQAILWAAVFSISCSGGDRLRQNYRYEAELGTRDGSFDSQR